MKIFRTGEHEFRVRGDGPKQVYIIAHPNVKLFEVIDRLCDLALSPEEIGKAVCLITSGDFKQTANNLDINYEALHLHVAREVS